MRISSRLRLLLDRARTSYFVIPGVAALGGVALAFLTLSMDRGGLPFRLPVPVEKMSDARSLITTIATTSISVAATVFSITIVILSLASSQFGPRLLRNFLKNRASQAILGLFVGTHTYCLVALRTVGSGWDVPQLTCLIALVLALAGALALIFFIHHTASWVQAERVIDVVADRLDAELTTLLQKQRAFYDADVWRPRLGESDGLVITPRGGYVQTHDDARLRRVAQKHDLIIERVVGAGDFVFDGRPIARVWGELDDATAKDIRDAFGVGDTRSDLQDPFHLVDQLIELALRALSPGINDPVTATTCINRVANALLPVLSRGLADPPALEDGQRPCLIAANPDFAGLCRRAFGEIRRAGSDQWLVVQRLRTVLPMLIEACDDAAIRADLERERAALPATPGDLD